MGRLEAQPRGHPPHSLPGHRGLQLLVSGLDRRAQICEGMPPKPQVNAMAGLHLHGILVAGKEEGIIHVLAQGLRVGFHGPCHEHCPERAETIGPKWGYL